MSISFPKQSASQMHPGLRVWGAALALAILTAAACSMPSSGQRGSGKSGGTSTIPMSAPNMDSLDRDPDYQGDPATTEAEQKRLAAMNAERQKQMVADTNKLVKMAADLNAQINSEHSSQLTIAQERQLADIEKLAHSIREKMSTSVVSYPPMMSPTIIRPVH